jgi:hypothetical protein
VRFADSAQDLGQGIFGGSAIWLKDSDHLAQPDALGLPGHLDHVVQGGRERDGAAGSEEVIR